MTAEPVGVKALLDGMRDAGFHVNAAGQPVLYDFGVRHHPEPRPLVVPQWIVDKVRAEYDGTPDEADAHMETEARSHGFDGITVVGAYPGTLPPLPVGAPNRAQRRAARKRRI